MPRPATHIPVTILPKSPRPAPVEPVAPAPIPPHKKPARPPVEPKAPKVRRERSEREKRRLMWLIVMLGGLVALVGMAGLWPMQFKNGTHDTLIGKIIDTFTPKPATTVTPGQQEVRNLDKQVFPQFQ